MSLSDKVSCNTGVDAIWRPFTQEKIAQKPITVVRGDGLYLYTEDGKKYADMISSWWVNIHGHANSEIAEAIAKQAATLEQVIFTTFCHRPAIDLVERLSKILPASLGYFFFSDNGSTAVEIALKMAYQFFKNKGEKKRTKYLHLEGSYHGDTFGAMSVSGRNSMYHFNFSDFFFETITVEVPEFYEGVEDAEDIDVEEDAIISKLEEQLNFSGDEVCALIVEPLLQGARGMVLYRPEFLEKLVKTVRKYGILVIFDEVFTGFYRTGRFFALDYLKKRENQEKDGCNFPDILCISKGITGGFMPLALTVTTSKIYDAFLADDFGHAFIHGHSYTGNPIACAAACKSMEILERPETISRINRIEKFHKEARLKALKGIASQTMKRRSLGVMSAFDLPSELAAKRVCSELFSKGIFVRPLGKTIYLLAPYCITEDELKWVYDTLDECLNDVVW